MRYVAVGVLALIAVAGLTLYNNKVANDDIETVNKPVVDQSTLEPKPEISKPSNSEPIPETEPVVSQWPITYTLEEAAGLTVVVNKKHRLPSNYVPKLQDVAGGRMRPEAANALKTLLYDAEQAGNSMIILSSYRSYNTQVSTYQYWDNTQGQAEADKASARPGHSEHQTGLAVDLGNPDGSCRLLACFGASTAGKWLENNAYKYGFIIRYPNGKEALTGYIYEPWHVRYVGTDESTAIKNSGQTMDQYYGVEAEDY